MTTQTPCCTVETVACGESADTGCCGSGCASGDSFIAVSKINTLAFSAERCINCGMCSAVCPHGVFMAGDKIVSIVQADACMECGACQLNCPVGALTVDSGVGCASAMINAALRGLPEPTCGGDTESCCC